MIYTIEIGWKLMATLMVAVLFAAAAMMPKKDPTPVFTINPSGKN